MQDFTRGGEAMEEPLTLEQAIAERDAIIKQLDEVAPQLQIRLAYLHGWIDSQQVTKANKTNIPSTSSQNKIKKTLKR